MLLHISSQMKHFPSFLQFLLFALSPLHPHKLRTQQSKSSYYFLNIIQHSTFYHGLPPKLPPSGLRIQFPIVWFARINNICKSGNFLSNPLNALSKVNICPVKSMVFYCNNATSILMYSFDFYVKHILF